MLIPSFKGGQIYHIAQFKTKNMRAIYLVPTAMVASTVGLLTTSAVILEPKQVAFGQQAQHLVLNQSVSLLNDSTQTLTITDLQSDCGCTIVKSGATTLAPGEKTALRIEFKTLEARGEVHRQVAITTNQGRFVLPVTATVNPYGTWQVLPQTVNFQGKADESQEMLVHLKGGKVIGFWSPYAWLEVTSPQDNELRIVRKKDAPAGALSGFIKVATDDKNQRELTIPVFASVQSGLVVNPTPLALGTTRQHQAKTLRFSLEGWTQEAPPNLKAPQGTVLLVGQENGFLYYDLTLPANEVGLVTAEINVYAQDKLQLSVPAIMRVLPKL